MGQLANVEQIPTEDQLKDVETKATFSDHTHEVAKQFLDCGKVMEAWKVLLEY